MESLSNQQLNGKQNVELTLMGIDKKWVRYNGSWVDKSTIPAKQEEEQSTSLISEELNVHVSPWWQFWRA